MDLVTAWDRCNAVRYYSGNVNVATDSIASHEISFHPRL